MRVYRLLLFLTVLVAGFREQAVSFVVATLPEPRPQVEPLPYRGVAAWRYAVDAPFHALLPATVQEFTSEDPGIAANRICAELGGTASYVALPTRAGTAPFVCSFSEPDVTMSLDFGDLRRIPAE